MYGGGLREASSRRCGGKLEQYCEEAERLRRDGFLPEPFPLLRRYNVKGTSGRVSHYAQGPATGPISTFFLMYPA